MNLHQRTVFPWSMIGIFFNTNFPDFMHSHLKNLIDFVSDLREKRELARTLINNALQCAVNGR